MELSLIGFSAIYATTCVVSGPFINYWATFEFNALKVVKLNLKWVGTRRVVTGAA